MKDYPFFKLAYEFLEKSKISNQELGIYWRYDLDKQSLSRCDEQLSENKIEWQSSIYVYNFDLFRPEEWN